MSLSNLLQYLLKEGMDEVAKSIGDAQSAKLALYREEGIAILFDPQAFYDEMDSLFGDKALENAFAKLQAEMERFKEIVPDKWFKYDLERLTLLKNWTYNVDKLNKKMQTFLSSGLAGGEAKEISGILGNIGAIYYKIFKLRAADLKGNPEERLKLNREKEAFESLSNRVTDGILLVTDPKYGIRNSDDLIKTALINSIRGYTDYVLSDSCNRRGSPRTYEVSYSGAKKGWGPLIYDITMSLVNPGYLIADRNANSTDADKIWTYYLKNRPDVHKELMEELITGEDCSLPTSSNKDLNDKLLRAQKLLDQQKGVSATGLTRDQLEDMIERYERYIKKQKYFAKTEEQFASIHNNEQKLANYEKELAEMQKGPDADRLADVIQEMKKILADVPQAWRYQIQTPIDISTLDNRYKLFIGRVKSVYGKDIDTDIIRRAGRIFFDINYIPGD